MATVSGSVSFLSLPPTKLLHLSSSSQSPSPSPSSSSSSSPQVPVTNPSTKPQSEPPIQSISVKSQGLPKPKVAASAPETTDWVASTLTRRFGLGAGLAWAGFLAIGVLSEQIKTRLEASQQEANTKDVEEAKEVILPNGIRYYETRIGGGAPPRPGDLVVIDLKGQVESSGQVFVDTFGVNKKPLALVMGSRPYTKGMCEGVEYVLRSMKAGGKRRVIVPPSLGFGDKGADLGSGLQIPPSATLEFIVQVDKVSIAPA
ncbi:peptidyl-prolyl cis-trans isomerase FKBP17-2, chloroplastic [Aristolochia californica]|uniref:peptidyl-prolyl cis-trans isomerase FKBP17-2, chloroplastic n=1 Tax=Aristolochia californica TaxID=171875 RepID=UPI0035DA0BDE